MLLWRSWDPKRITKVFRTGTFQQCTIWTSSAATFQTTLESWRVLRNISEGVQYRGRGHQKYATADILLGIWKCRIEVKTRPVKAVHAPRTNILGVIAPKRWQAVAWRAPKQHSHNGQGDTQWETSRSSVLSYITTYIFPSLLFRPSSTSHYSQLVQIRHTICGMFFCLLIFSNISLAAVADLLPVSFWHVERQSFPISSKAMSKSLVDATIVYVHRPFYAPNSRADSVRAIGPHT